MIVIEVTADRPKDWAAAMVEGRRYEARSSAGAIFALCRVLVAADVPDQPWKAINIAAPGAISLRGQSVHASAGLTIEQADDREPRFRRWTPRGESAPRGGGERPRMRNSDVSHTVGRASPSDTHQQACATCGQAYVGRRAWKRFCSSRCRVRAMRMRDRTTGVRPEPLQAPFDGSRVARQG
jgi:hypothetical protein